MFARNFIFIFFLFFTAISNVNALDTSRSSIVMEVTTGRVLYEQNSNQKKLIASTTKIMTAIIVIENTELNEKVKVGEEILSMYGTNIYLEVGEIITVKDLLYGLILRSGNDAAIALATYVGGTEEEFVKMMNKKALEIGMNNTNFSNSHGLDDYNENYSTAYDMAQLSIYASKNQTYQKIASTKKYSTQSNSKSYLWYNRNKLLTSYEYCTGGKNGYTPKAGRTLVTTAKKNNLTLTAVTLNTSNDYELHQSLYNKIYDSYTMYKIIDKKNIQSYLNTKKQKYKISENFFYPIKSSEKELISTEVTMYETEQSEIAGHIRIKLKEEIIGTVNIYNAQQKKEDISIFTKIWNYLLDILKKLIPGRQNNLKPGPLVPIPPDTYTSVLLTL